MIAALDGKVLQKDLDRVVVDVGGVGYLVHVSMQTHSDLPPLGERVQLLCHTHVREDALQVFGFMVAAELSAFELLITVSGVGPKLALTTLSGLPVGELLTAIAAGDIKKLQSVPGVGRKTAERIVVDLKDRCAKLAGSATPAARASRPVEEVVDALVNLGYKRSVADKAVVRAEEVLGGGNLEELLRRALMAVREL